MINKISKLWLFVMSRFVQFLLVSVMLVPIGAKAAQATCIENKAALLELDFMSFDQDFEGGWRAVADTPGCKPEAVKLIEAYQQQRTDLSDGMKHTLRLHQAQLHAELGHNEAAIALFRQSYKPDEQDRSGWNPYMDATIAFIKKDKPKLVDAIARLKAVPRPEGFDPRDAEGNPIEVPWPPNLTIVESYLRCFDMNYVEVNVEGQCPRPKNDETAD